MPKIVTAKPVTKGKVVHNIDDSLAALAVPVESLTPDPRNAKRHPERNMQAIMESLSEFGQTKPLVVRREGMVVMAGNGTLEAAKRLGWTHVAANVKDMTEVKAIKYGMADNRSADLGEYDMQVLDQLHQILQDAGEGQIGWTQDELEILRMNDWTEPEQPETTPEDPGAQIDRAEELRKKWGTELGQLWVIGRHRLLCGDSTSAEDVKRLIGGVNLRMVWTDPPYGVSYGAKNEFLNSIAPANRIQTPIENDQLTEEQTEKLASDALTLACFHSTPGASCYVACPAGTLLPHFIAAVKASGFQYKHSLVWVKQHFVLGRCDYHYRHEVILYGWKAGPHYFVDDHTKSSVFEYDKPHKSDLHPTTKPCEMVAEMVINSSKLGEVVYDPFVGSGSTLVACEQVGRAGYGVEVCPPYVAVTLERLSQMGLEPKLEQ